jgi:PHD/YefM family antitoxin component YafN of YafNO toxin-antitoxin module|tara:strand:+ start:299 stop:532 length:234 start_codon:yes stop_codon:yes gene_type:complete
MHMVFSKWLVTGLKNLLYNLAMEIFTVQEFQKNWDELIKRVENGEHIGIVNENGAACVMMSTDDDLYKMYTEHEEGC